MLIMKDPRSHINIRFRLREVWRRLLAMVTYTAGKVIKVLWWFWLVEVLCRLHEMSVFGGRGCTENVVFNIVTACSQPLELVLKVQVEDLDLTDFSEGSRDPQGASLSSREELLLVNWIVRLVVAIGSGDHFQVMRVPGILNFWNGVFLQGTLLFLSLFSSGTQAI